MSRKVVYNNCYGGFSISTEALLLARQQSGNPFWGGARIAGEAYPDGTIASGGVLASFGHHINDIKRDDPILVQVVEQLGDKANGRCSKLAIETVDGPYRIVEYDGNETVETPDSISWS